ncbi:MAG: MNIO family bufferin maturase, partial [Lysobacter sp.]
SALLDSSRFPANTGLPRQAGVGFKPQHLQALLADVDAPAFVEVHAENYMGAGGASHAGLTRIRERGPISIHGVGLSIGAEVPLDSVHLDRLAHLLERYQPAAFSEHLAWSTHDGRFLSDLLPLTYDAPTLDRVCAHIDQVQQRLRTRMLLENPSTYFEFEASCMTEPEFIARVVERTGCGLLLDVNNVHVSCHNHRHDPWAYLSALPLSSVGEIHLAGHAMEVADDGQSLLIDNHGAPVAPAVWALYARVLAVTGPIATLIEWDQDVPTYAGLRAQARRADRMLDAKRMASARAAAIGRAA